MFGGTSSTITALILPAPHQRTGACRDRLGRADVRAAASARRTLRFVVRNAGIVAAVLAGLGAALLLATGPTVVVKGHTRSCPGVIVTAEARAGIPDGEQNGRTTPCDRVQTRWTWYATGLGLLALVAGTGAAFYRREDEPSAAPTLAGPSPTV